MTAMTLRARIGLACVLWWAATLGWCRRARTVLGWRYRLVPLQLLGPRIAVRECRVFRYELEYTADVVGRLWDERRHV